MFALLKVSAALGSLGTSDRTPTAAGRQAHPSARSRSGASGQTWASWVRALLAEVREGQFSASLLFSELPLQPIVPQGSLSSPGPA